MDSIERELNKTLSRKTAYDSEKVGRLNALKLQLKRAETDRERYALQKILFEAYQSYQIDSAIRYVSANEQLAYRLNDSKLQYESLIQLAGLYSYATTLELILISIRTMVKALIFMSTSTRADDIETLW